MQLKKKIFSITIIILTIGVIFFSMNNLVNSNDPLVILEKFEFEAVFLEDDYLVQIYFEDKSNNTKSAVLEILGMDITYHQEYRFDKDSKFVEKMYLEKIPKYGWQTTPVTLEIQHSQFGNIGLKTEIHEPSKSKPRIIIEQ